MITYYSAILPKKRVIYIPFISDCFNKVMHLSLKKDLMWVWAQQKEVVLEKSIRVIGLLFKFSFILHCDLSQFNVNI